MANNLQLFLNQIKEKFPQELITIEKSVNPAAFDVTALLKHLEDEGNFPILLFDSPLNLENKKATFKLVTNVFATRQRCAVALGLKPEDWKLEMSLEYSRRKGQPVVPEIIDKNKAPDRELVFSGENVDLR